MGKLKDATVSNKARVQQPTSRTPVQNGAPMRFTYALARYTAEIRGDGWYVAKSTPSFAGERPNWSGPFATIETAVLAIGRRLATEIADRHTRSIEWHKIKPGDPLQGLKPTTRLCKSDSEQ